MVGCNPPCVHKGSDAIVAGAPAAWMDIVGQGVVPCMPLLSNPSAQPSLSTAMKGLRFAMPRIRQAADKVAQGVGHAYRSAIGHGSAKPNTILSNNFAANGWVPQDVTVPW